MDHADIANALKELGIAEDFERNDLTCPGYTS